MRTWLMATVALAAGFPAMAAERATPLTLERVFAAPDLAGPQPRALKLSPDGKLLTFLRPRPDDRDRLDLWARDTATGVERMLVDSRKVGTGAALSEAEKMQRERARIGALKGIVSYDWSADGRSLLVPLDGDIYLATLDGEVRRITDVPGGVLNADVSPRGAFVSYVRDQNLFVQPVAGGAARALTTEGRGTVHFGEAEFVAQEEMDRRTGYWWSPDDRHVAVERFDEAPVKVSTRAAIGATGTSVYEQRYPAAGTPNVAVELYVMRADGSGRVKVDLGNDPDIYLARVDWLPDGSALLVQRENRAQTALDMLRVDPATGKATVIFTERAREKSWINLTDSYRAMKDGSLLWRSERDGFGHFWRWKDGRWTQLTRGPWVVTGLVGVDEAKGRVYFTANKDDVLEQHLYALDLKRGGITRLTERGWYNSVTADGAAGRFLVTRSNPDQPPQTYLADADGKRLAWINENRVEGTHPYAPFMASHEPLRYGTIKAADGTTDLHWQMVTPRLEPGKHYPVFFQHYGGPGPQGVARNWKNPLIQYLVDKGWIYFELDNRGSANRGVEFESAIWHAMGTVEVADQRAGARYLTSLAYVDPKRIATFGWSYGGYMSLKMIEADPGIYAAAVSGAPVTDWHLYDTHYTERYMGDPRVDGAAYDAARAVIDPKKITTPLLLMHGMADDNVFLDNSTKVAAELQAADVPFDMMFYPGKTHSASRDIHVWTTIERFLEQHVGAGPR
ncbi:MAG: S9 family peptidase [Sphingomonas taxi]|uniref:S9 family peptidase n=1 Tax=Sphingomonas taxi TaxID=1549858 RepID=A0A2W5P0G5_9SPHN|nr:MAG: S9 family peptidase [Sphingomonas taxi]